MALRESDPRKALLAFICTHGGLTPAAALLGCSKQFVSQLTKGQKRIPDTMLGKLGLRRPIVAEK